jgi:hypothetical protein
MEIITRPIAMLFFEPIITSTSIYIALAYSLVFFYFQAYPIIFGGNAPLGIRISYPILT